MYKIYFRQAIQILKQNKVMSIISIAGTVLAIMMIMTIIVTEEIKNASVTPEANRYRTYYMDGYLERDSVGWGASRGSVSYDIIHNYLKDLQEPEFVSIYSPWQRFVNITVNASGKKETFWLGVRGTDAAYWKIMSFAFLKGKSYTQEEFESGMNYAVISESRARKLFMDKDPINQTMEINKKEYRIIGVVKDVPPLFKQAKSDVWIPYTSENRYEDSSYMVAILAESTKDFPAISAEIRSVEKKYNTEREPKKLELRGPYNHQVLLAEIEGYSEEEIKESISILHRRKIFILTILLLVPALNLSGFSLSRVKKRASEIGVRKAFGAKKYVILIQVLYENFITSLIGGVLGLLLSYVAIFQLRRWLLGIADDSVIPINTLISPAIFIAVFLVCLLINLLSAGLPAYRASRTSIINSINQNDKQV